MFLRRIELVGFKSFADRSVLEFGPGLTAIVGPNGSGKSNVTDGLRWVLGEQSARELRGSRMEDLIFSGSRTRKPVGMAQVSVSLDNSDGSLPLDYTEVVLARRLFRDGASEYLLNGAQVRLRDILDTLLDTGFGRSVCTVFDETKMEAILSGRSADRRLLLEEAAGVARFRLRREEARRKLEETRLDLVRVSDLTRELGQGLAPLEAEAARLRHYRATWEMMRSIALGALGRELTRLEETAAHLNGRLARLESRGRDARAWSGEAQTEAERLEALLAELEPKTAQVQSEILALTRESERVKGLSAIEAAREERLQRDAAELAAQMAADERRLAGLVPELESAVGRVGELEAQEERATRRREELSAQEAVFEHAVAETGTQAAVVTRQVASLQGSIESVARVLRAAEAEALSRAEREKLGEDRRRRTREALSALESRVEALRARMRDIELGMEGARSAAERDKGEVERERRRVEETRRSLEDERAATAAVSARLRMLEEMSASGEGYRRGAREVLQRKGELGGIVGAVGQLLSVPQDLVEAIDAALADGTSDVVVETCADARRAIAFLRNRGLGRATFIPLELARRLAPGGPGSGFRSRVSSMPGVRGLAIDLVECDPAGRGALEGLLGRVVLCEDLASAERVAGVTGCTACAVTLSGEVVHPGGKMSGGRAPEGPRPGAPPVLARQGLADALRREAGQRARRVGELESGLRGAETALAAAEARLAEQAARVHELDLDRSTVRSEAAALVEQAAGLSAELSARPEAPHPDPGAAASAEGVDRLRTKLAGLETLRQALGSEAEGLSATLARLTGELERVRRLLAETSVELTRVSVARESAARDVSRIRRESADCEARIAARRSRLDSARTESGSSRARLASLRAKQGEVEGGIVGLERTGAELRARAESTRTSLQEARARARESATLADSLHKRAERDRLELAALAPQAEGVRSKILADWSATLEEALHHARSAEGEGQVRGEGRAETGAVTEEAAAVEAGAWARVRRLQEELAAMEPVNQRALDDLEALQARLSFLRAQYRDAQEARDSLEKAAQELEAHAAQRFLAAFQAIRDEFGRMFRELFRGGECDLVLGGDGSSAGGDGSHVLDCDIELVAAPPGKRRTPISLLSGGEKALTAIALMFGIISAGRVPFCVLDEVDAMLDDANVARFVDLVGRLKDGTQIVVITHRKRTMEAASRVYGVTMQEPGVSLLGSVDLDRLAS